MCTARGAERRDRLVPAEPGRAHTGRFCCSMYCLTTDTYESLLSDEKRKILLKARTFMRDEIKPLVNENWARPSSRRS
ncbi:hypothetical protein SAMN02787118_114105 [Streptomyces mirabilis]|uniref:Uncharacterized protein n=1 Tax=Streptomyces mirabilis TaxID=68239 RepID=A0A1I2N5M6_9ACTN|nr:hypothetical protein SAMN02787118_114105 [Streptomyces mirabilis]